MVTISLYFFLFPNFVTYFFKLIGKELQWIPMYHWNCKMLGTRYLFTIRELKDSHRITGDSDDILTCNTVILNRLNQTEPATFSILTSWAFFRDFLYCSLFYGISCADWKCQLRKIPWTCAPAGKNRNDLKAANILTRNQDESFSNFVIWLTQNLF
jgi:hypothetical protein